MRKAREKNSPSRDIRSKSQPSAKVEERSPGRDLPANDLPAPDKSEGHGRRPEAVQHRLRLTTTDLRRRCVPEDFPFGLTSEVEVGEEIIGQDRAVEAIRFGVDIRRTGFNVFALGVPGSGKRSIVLRVLDEHARERPAPSGWCYVARMDDEEKPRALRFPPGQATAFRRDMDHLIDELLEVLPAAFETVEYTRARSELETELDERSRDAYETVRIEAAESGLLMLNGNDGVRFVPSENGLPREAGFEGLDEVERHAMETRAAGLRTEVDLAARTSRAAVREVRHELEQLTRTTAEVELAARMQVLYERYSDLQPVLEHLSSVSEDMLANIDLFLPDDDVDPASGYGNPADLEYYRQERKKRLDRYRVNVLVDPDPEQPAPVVYEPHPSLGNLLGRIEQRQMFGALTTDFSMLRPGALHRANEGYLVLDASDLLREPGSWEALKRAIRTAEVKIGSTDESSGPFTTITLMPEPIPLDIKVVLVGDLDIHQALYESDPELAELFKVQAEFGDSMPRTPAAERQYAGFVAALAAKEELRAFSRDAVAAVVEHGARAAEDAARLSTRFAEIADILREADYWAGSEGSLTVGTSHVERALAARIRRADLSRELIAEAIARDVVLLDTDGESIGRVNGVTVYAAGEFEFGIPIRISARVRQGNGELVDIEREVELGGPMHSKGVLILGGFVSGRYLPEDSLAFSATLTFEQSASHIDGDSASLAELLALLSAIADVPLRQGIAVTGSVNQEGLVQAVGAANEKIEGFFDVCRSRGFTGSQGVIIPEANAQHLMLRQDVCDAVEAGDFSVYAVGSVDDAIEVLTGLPAGERGPDGRYPVGSFNRAVESRLLDLARRKRESDSED